MLSFSVSTLATSNFKMRDKGPITEETYIRSLPYSVLKHASSLLDIDGHWGRFVILIPRRLCDLEKPTAEKRYSQLQIRMFEDRARRPDGSPTKCVLEDWGTQNTRVKHLLSLLQQAALYEVADYIAVNVLHGPKVSRGPVDESLATSLPTPQWVPQKPEADTCPEPQQKLGEANFNYENTKPGDMYKNKNVCGPISSDKAGYYNDIGSSSSNNDEVMYHRIPSYDSGGIPSIGLGMENFESGGAAGGRSEEETVQVRPVPPPPRQAKEPCETSDIEETTCNSIDAAPSSLEGLTQKMAFISLETITDRFNINPLSKGGRVIGRGGFGDVFLGILEDGSKVAVKQLKVVEEMEKQFLTELESLTKYRHTNIVALYGYSVDGPSKCLVYEYLVNGSLEDRLNLIDKSLPLPPKIRVSILQGTATGIHYLNKQGIIHRDIKSANVLLDENFTPKVGDFATTRCGPKGTGTSAVNTSVVIGTSAYLAPEATHFDISTKLDSYSYGVVILEVLTGLPPLDQTRSEKDLITFVEEQEIYDILDTSGGDWDDRTISILMSVAKKCSQLKKKTRANIEDILPELQSI